MTYQVKLPVFEGPMDLLLHLIEKKKIDIYDIPIALIAEEYLNYINAMKELDLDVTSEFLVMAANLLAIKAKLLLPQDEKEEEAAEDEEAGPDPRQELVERLIEYKKYKKVAEILKEREKSNWRSFPNDLSDFSEFISEVPLTPSISFDQLLKALSGVLNRKFKDEKEIKIPDLPREDYKVSDKIWEIKKLLYFKKSVLSFNKLLLNCSSRLEVVVTFLALLELMKISEIKAVQEKPFDDIIFYGVENGRSNES